MEQYTGHFMQHLPYLRRYARALTGTNGRGDALVTRTLEWYLEADEAETGRGGDLSRGTLYRHLNELQDEEGAPPAVAEWVPALDPSEAAVEFHDHARGGLRLAWMDGDRLEACLFVAADGRLPPRGWLAGLPPAPSRFAWALRSIIVAATAISIPHSVRPDLCSARSTPSVLVPECV